MPITPAQIIGDNGSTLATLMRDGIGALTGAINNSIKVGQDRATTQLNQEGTLFNVLQNNANLNLRKAEDLRKNFEADRNFGFDAYKTEQTFKRADRAFDYTVDKNAQEFGRQLGLDRVAEERYADTKARADAELALRKDEVQTRIDTMLGNNAVRDTKVSQQNALDATLLASPVLPQIQNPSQRSELPDTALSDFYDQSTQSSDPAIQALGGVALRELQTRNNKVDAKTGKTIPEKFSSDKKNIFRDATPDEAKLLVGKLQKEIEDHKQLLNDPKTKANVKATLIREIGDLEEKLNYAPTELLVAPPAPVGPPAGTGTGTALDFVKGYKPQTTP